MINSILCIAGPTASGKSALAVRLAKTCCGEIVNADALQVYQELQILSARPGDVEMEGIPHHLYGHVSAAQRYSTGDWLREVDRLIINILARGKTPILVGGTGLYFKALTEGLAKIPDPGDAARQEAQMLYDNYGIDALRERAEGLDPAASAKVLGGDPQRLIRIVSVASGTGLPISYWQKDTRPILPRGIWNGLALTPPRALAYEKINARFADMARSGGLDEARRVMEMKLSPDLPAMKAIGLRELISFHRGEMDMDEAVETASRETRRFAKRQYTWIRGQMSAWAQAETLDEGFDLLSGVAMRSS